ncbi:hypothetical protein LJC04_03620 [Ruminococcaceae bacterium OttesenSCG-928-O06]|nr:hypothetical protein [Ruminococcaceae bacterium OttesenSCG-928-O06]
MTKQTTKMRLGSGLLVLCIVVALFGALGLALPLRARAAVETIQLDTLAGGESGNGWSYTAGSPNTLTISANGDGTGDGFLLNGSPASPIRILVDTAGPVTLSSGGAVLTNVYIEVTASTATLTLADLTLTAPATMASAHALSFSSASGPHALSFSGGVSLTGGTNATDNGAGISSVAALTITGANATSSLTATGGGPATNRNGGRGIYLTSGNLVLNGAGTLTATGGKGESAYSGGVGIATTISGNMTMEAGSALHVTATGGEGGATNGPGGAGLWASGTLEVLGGSLKATGGAGHGTFSAGHGIFCQSARLAAPTEAYGGSHDGSLTSGAGVCTTVAAGLTVESTLTAQGGANTGTGLGGSGILISPEGSFTVSAGAVVNATGGESGDTWGGTGVYMGGFAGNLNLSGQLVATGGNSTSAQITSTSGAGMALHNSTSKVVFKVAAARLTIADGDNAYKRPATQTLPLQNDVPGSTWEVDPIANLITGTPQDVNIAVQSVISNPTVITLILPTPTPTPTPDPGPGSPQTGDNTNIPLWALCGSLALAGLTLCGIAARKRFGRKAG